MDKRKIENLSLVIPCFNEPENIPLVIEQLKKIVYTSPFMLEIIIVDGCSTDTTPQILKKEFDSLNPDNFKLVLQQERRGYGYDIIAGLNIATHDVMAWTHADMQTDINDVILGLQLYQSLLDDNPSAKILIKGKRVGRPLLDVILTFGMQLCSLFLLRSNLNDINAQPKIFSRTFYESFLKTGSPHDFSLDLFALIQAKRNKFSSHSFPVDFKKRLLGKAKGGGGSLKNRVNLIKRTLKYIFKLRQAG